MKKILLAFGCCLLFLSCVKDNGGSDTKDEWVCGTYNGKTLYTGKRGVCYYKQPDGDKTYVDREHCKC